MFKPGQSGNPGGRTKKLEALRINICKMEEAHLARLQDIAANGEHKDAIAAIKLMWGYAYGNPATVVTTEDGEPFKLDAGELIDTFKKIVGG